MQGQSGHPGGPELIGARQAELTTETRLKIERLLNGRRLGVLATKEPNGQPYANLVAFAANSDCSEIYFATLEETRKYHNLTQEPRAALLVDNSANEAADFSLAAAVTVMGAARLLKGDKKRGALDRYLKKHPHLKTFAQAPGCALFAIDVSRFIFVEHFQEAPEAPPDHTEGAA